MTFLWDEAEVIKVEFGFVASAKLCNYKVTNTNLD